MSISIKFKDDAYLDSSSVAHNKELLSEFLENEKTKLSNLSAYSTEETVVGTYLDKLRYRKVIIKTVAKNTTTNYTLESLGISDVDIMIVNTGDSTAHYGTGIGLSYSPISYYVSSSDRAHAYLNGQGQLVIQNINSNERTYYIVLEYTKTTD